jgi:hypothetical protein
MSFDAYAIAIKLSLVNNVSSGLSSLATQFAGLNRHAIGTQTALTDIEKRLTSIKKLGLIGGAMAGAGFAGLEMLRGPLEQAMEWNRQLARMQQQGLGDLQIRDAQKYVQATDIIGTSMQQRMKLFVDAQGAFRESGMSGLGALDAAKVMMPVMAKYQVAAQMLSGPQADSANTGMQNLNKTVELLRGLNDPKRAALIADGVFKATQSSGGMVDERNLRQFITQAGTAAAGLSLKSIFATLEPIIGEFGGSIAGTGLQTAYNRAHGIISRPPRLMVNEMLRMGLWDRSHLTFNSQGGVKSLRGDPMTGPLANLQETDPAAFAQAMVGIYAAHGITSIADQARENSILFGNTGGRIYTKIMQQLPVLARSGAAFDKAKGIDQTAADDANSPMMAMLNLQKSMNDLGLTIGNNLLPKLPPLVNGITALARQMEKYPILLGALSTGFAALSVSMAISGTIMLTTAAFKGLGLAFKVLTLGEGGGLIVQAATALTGLGGGLIGMTTALMTNPYVLALMAIAGAPYAVYKSGAGDWLGGKLYEMTHGDPGAPLVAHPNGVSHYVAPGGKSGGNVTTSIHLDGRKVATAVTPYIADPMGRGMTGSGFDDILALPMPGVR